MMMITLIKSLNYIIIIHFVNFSSDIQYDKKKRTY